jgi:predicted RNA binding protein YcfA (HicA-like mRNA interferase family)
MAPLLAPVKRVVRPRFTSLPGCCYNSGVKVKEIIEVIEQDGWYLVTTKGSHRQYKHPTKPGRVTVPGKLSADLAPGTQNSILKQAGLKD